MLKQIGVEDLRLGMFIHELCGSWIDHPFWRSSIKLEDSAVLKQILDSPVKQVVIDISKGLDVEVAVAAPLVVQAEPEKTPAPAAQAVIQKVSLDEEMGRAAKICANARGAVSSMFQEARMGKAIDTKHALPIVEEISSSVSRNPGALIGLARLKNKDDYTYMHSVAVCALMVALARQLKLNDEQVREAGMAGLLHDIGKMMIPLDILNKPGKLTDLEFHTVKSHPEDGHKLLLSGTGVSEVTLDVCLHHHEKMAGNGYPHKLKGEQISLFARMGAVCDVYDAITSNRPYKAGWEPSESIRKMAEWSGPHFDPTVFQAFVKSIGIYPVGTLVKLESGRLGVVVEQAEKSLLAPKVKIFFSTKSSSYIPPQILDLSGPGLQDKIVGREDPAKWELKNVNSFWLGDAA
ncbi:MAG TPA: HD-GYP domain-containing protein [Burkholderiaceae bacterium]|jgi:putative nucleotidyltransferase with HDIG domain